MKEITSAKKKPIKKSYILPDWSVWPLYFFFLTAILVMLGSAVGWIFSGEVLLGSLALVFYLVIFYLMGTFFLTLPTRMIANRLISARQYFAMEKRHRRCLEVIRRLHLPKDDNYVSLLTNLGLAQMQQGKYREAAATYVQAIEESDKLKANDRISGMMPRLNYAAVLVRSQRLHEALELYDECERRLPELAESMQVYKLIIELGRARALTHYDAWDEAEAHCLTGLAVLEASLQSPFLKNGLPSLKFAFASSLALICAKQGRLSESFEHCHQMLTLAAQDVTALDVNSGFTLALLAETYLGLNESERAEAILELAYEEAREFPLHPDAARVQDVYAKLLEDTARKDEIPDMRSWLRPIARKTAVEVART